MTTTPMAFPSVPEAGPNRVGMTLRDYFAARIIGAIVAHEGMPLDCNAEARSAATNDAKRAYMYADAMLKERSK